MSNSQHLEYDPYGGGGSYVDLHNAETIAYGVYAAPGTYDDTYRPAYEAYGAYGDHEAYGDHGAHGAYEAPPPPPETLVLPEPVQLAAEPPFPRQSAGRAGRRRRTRSAERPESTMRRLLPQALVVAFLAGGTTAFVAEDKAVELTVDGKPRTCTPSPTTWANSSRRRACR